MVATGFSTRRIKSYLQRFFRWWVTTTELWTYEELITWFCDASFDINATVLAAGLLLRHDTASHHQTITYDLRLQTAGVAVAAIAA